MSLASMSSVMCFIHVQLFQDDRVGCVEFTTVFNFHAV